MALETRTLAPSPLLAVLFAAVLACAASAQAPYTQRLDKALDGSPTDAASYAASISADGGTVMFSSTASNL
ncbi:MAG: hypothetical protein P1V81_04530, partial [Planctomycetota bacterium]|nr:hypothetical protein [Planctomycetota bacterium]